MTVEQDGLDFGQERIIAIDVSPTRLHHSDLRVGEVMDGFEQEIRGWNEVGIEDSDKLALSRHQSFMVRSEVPVGSGLSSSASLEVASALALLSLSGKTLQLKEIAKLCQRAENEFVGARVGIMDQFVSCHGKAGHAVLLDCRSLDYELVPIPEQVQFVICNTM